MTRDRARKKAIRARMAASEETYSVAARKLDAAPAASDAAVREVIARANTTLAAASARIEYRRDAELVSPEQAVRRRPGPVGLLASLLTGAAWKPVVPQEEVARLRERFLHQVGAGFVEPAAGRYQIDYGGYAQTYVDGTLFGGPPGAPLRAGNRPRRQRPPEDDPLGLLSRLREVTRARYSGTETLRGTRCRAVSVLAGSAELTVWIDDEHVRLIQSEWRGPTPRSVGTVRQTFELWDFGVPVGSLDWTSLPSLLPPG